MTQTLGINAPSPLQQMHTPWAVAHKLKLWCKRDDLLHPIISGNKWRKLVWPLQQLIATQEAHRPTRILSFGGAHSNHLHALAYCCYALNMQLVAIVRGNYRDNPTSTLQDLAQWGAQVVFTPKLDYQKRDQTDYINGLKLKHNTPYVIPEGGSQQDAIIGLQGLVKELKQSEISIQQLFLPVASGGTLAGLIHAYNGQADAPLLQGIAVLKGQDYLESLVENILPLPLEHYSTPWQINHEHHGGAYAKSSTELKHFCEVFAQQSHIPLEPVYSGKCAYAMTHILSQTNVSEHPACSAGQAQNIVMLHTGGLPTSRTSA